MTSYVDKPSKKIPKEGYEEFYRAVFGNSYDRPFETLVLPPDYKESVLYVLEQGTFKQKHVMIVKRMYGIGGREKEPVRRIAADLNMSEANVRAHADVVVHKCRWRTLREILLSGIAAFREQMGDLAALPDEIKTLQETWQALEKEYKALREKSKNILAEMQALENTFAIEHGVTQYRARGIARKPVTDLTYLEADRLIHTKI